MKWNREEYIELVTFGSAKKQMFTEIFGLLVGLEDEWRMQGASESEISLEAFDWDYVSRVGCGTNTGIRGGFKTRLLEETDQYVISIDNLGRRMKLCKGAATIPLPLDYPVKDMDSWLKIKPLFEFHEDRINWEKVEHAAKMQRSGALVTTTIPGGYHLPRDLMGDETACLCYYDQPELMLDILETVGNTAYKVLERVTDKIVVDSLEIGEDFAGKSGPLIGPEIIRSFIKPYYRKIWDLLSSRGAKIFSVDSDGNLNPIIDDLLDCGVTLLYPMEPAAGMDIVELRKKYGKRLALTGGIDKHILRDSKDAIRKELEYKMQPVMLEGGTVFGLDHRITNGTPIENYRYYVNTGRELLGLPPLKNI